MLSDLFASLGPDEMPAVVALGSALKANQKDNSADAITNARIASGLFARHHNMAGDLWARYAEIYAFQRQQSGSACLAAIARLNKPLERTSYHWLQGSLALERAICRNFTGVLDDAETDADLEKSESVAAQFGFPILHFRIIGIAPGIKRQHSHTCEDTWGQVLKGLEEYWSGAYPWERLYQFYSVLEQCAEQEDHWTQAKALLDLMIKMRTSLDKQAKDLNMLGILYVHAAKIDTSLGDYAGAEDAARHAKAISDKAPAPHPYELVARIILAECQLKRGNAEGALALLEPIVDLPPDKLDLLDLRRVTGRVRLQLGQLLEAEEAYKQGISISEGSLSTVIDAKQGIEWAAKTQELYRGLVEIWLQQQRTVEAWKLWEWSKTRSAYAQHPDSSAASAATSWKTLERNILAFPIPPEPGIRLVYAVFSSRVHVWMVSKGQVHSRWIEIREEKLGGLVDGFARNCANGSSSIEELQKQGEALFTLLIQPFVGEFNAKQTVVFEVDQELWKLPFQALRSSDGWYLAEKYYIGYSPGILVEKMLSQARRMHVGNSLLQVNAYPGYTGNLNQISDRFIDPTVRVGASTSKPELLELARRSDVLFFFGHAVPEGRGIVLTLNDDDVLRAVDFPPSTVHRLSLVILAACSTGSTGRYGLLDSNSLVRAFLAGGVPDVIASQWDVYNGATDSLMNGFFRNSLNGESIAWAMKDAEREFLRLHAQDKYRHPYYWAGFMVVGREDFTRPARPQRGVTMTTVTQ